MKKRFATVLFTAVLSASMLAGCGSTTATSSAASASSTTAAVSAVSTTAPAEEAVKSTSTTASSESVTATSYAPIDLADGTYTADFETDSSMFRANEATGDKGTLTVKDGKATIHVSLAGTGIVNLFVGTKEDAQKDGAVLLQPTNDTVKYDDGTTEDVYGFDIPVPVIGQEFDVAIIGTKGKWYDHKVTVSNPTPLDEDVTSSSSQG